MEDIILTIKVPREKATKALEGLLYARPKEQGFVGTDKEWVEEILKRFLSTTARQGLLAKAQADANVDMSFTE
jgi:hypothetical protein